jgi:hypothetical protein
VISWEEIMWGSKSSPPPPPTLGPLSEWVFDDPIIFKWASYLFLAQVVLQVLLGVLDTPLKVKPGVAAHQIIALVPFCYAAWWGWELWMRDESIARFHAGTYIDRLYGTNDGTWTLTRFMIGFQVYDLLSTGLVKDLQKAEHLGHHFATLCTALGGASMGGPFAQYYVAFFFGFTELSSVPLAFVDLFRQVKDLAETGVGSALNEVSRTLFVLSFLPIRCVWFPIVMVTKFWPDMIEAYSSDDIRCPMITYYWMFFSSSFLTFLQLFWGYKIMRVVMKGNVTGKGAKGANAAKEA